ncbi:alpha/beta fold hydrolase [Phytohabitans houttuyneae]|nr:alpha/beta hydrolase [Phytohabitans houttuyneae]
MMVTRLWRPAAALAVAVLWGVVAARWTPRGPLTNADALWSVGISAAVGLAAGWASRSRWSMLAAPAAFVAALELTRAGVPGPSVDAPHASPFGILALVTGRGVHGVLSVLPLVLGAAYGAGLTRRGQRASRIRRAATALVTAALVALTAAVAIPARTASTGPGGVADLAAVHGLRVMIRGQDAAAPVLLFIPGAPGGSELGAMRRRLAPLEKRFVVATLDRRGGGGSYPALDPTGAATLDGAVADTIAVTDYLRDRFGRARIYLLAHSGGSIVGVLAAQRHPDRYHAYIGTGQAVDLTASDRIFHTDVLAWARATGRDGLARQLAAQGPPPYDSVYGYEPLMTYAPEAYGQGTPAFTVDVPEYTLLQKVHTLNAILDTWSAQYPSMARVDLRRDVPRLEVPAYFVQGGREMRGLAVPFAQWYERLQAPRKHQEVFAAAGHRAMFDEPGRFVSFMERLLPPP